jgi:hypothetical protein
MTDSNKNIKNSTGKIYVSLIAALLTTLVEVGIYDISNFMISTKYYGLLVSLLIILIVLYKKQFFINDKNYLEEMIENHSMALLTSNAIIKKTKNDGIKKLAENIIKNQNKEIEIMNSIIKEITPVVNKENDVKNNTKNDVSENEIKKDEIKKDEIKKDEIKKNVVIEDEVKKELKNENNEKLKNIIN